MDENEIQYLLNLIRVHGEGGRSSDDGVTAYGGGGQVDIRMPYLDNKFLKNIAMVLEGGGYRVKVPKYDYTDDHTKLQRLGISGDISDNERISLQLARELEANKLFNQIAPTITYTRNF